MWFLVIVLVTQLVYVFNISELFVFFSCLLVFFLCFYSILLTGGLVAFSDCTSVQCHDY